MQKEFNKAEELFGNLKDYINIKIDQLKLGLAEKISSILSSIISRYYVKVLFSVFILFLSIGIALLVGDVLKAPWAGFMIVAGLYLLASALVWKMREQWIRIPILNRLLEILFEEKSKKGTNES